MNFQKQYNPNFWTNHIFSLFSIFSRNILRSLKSTVSSLVGGTSGLPWWHHPTLYTLQNGLELPVWPIPPLPCQCCSRKLSASLTQRAILRPRTAATPRHRALIVLHPPAGTSLGLILSLLSFASLWYKTHSLYHLIIQKNPFQSPLAI